MPECAGKRLFFIFLFSAANELKSAVIEVEMCTECTLNLCHLVYFNQDYCVFYLLFLIGLCFQPFFITPLTWLGQLNIERNVMFHLFIVYFLLNLNFSFSVLTHFKHSQLQCMVFKHWTMRHVLVIVPINTQKVSLTLTRNPPRLLIYLPTHDCVKRSNRAVHLQSS